MSAVLVTRGNVDMTPVVEPIEQAGIHDIVIVDNSKRPEDLTVFGRYMGIAEARHEIIYVQDDDCYLPSESIRRLAGWYKRATLTANMPPEYRARYPHSCLVGFGAVFHRDLPRIAFAKFLAKHNLDPDVFNRTCDLVFAGLTQRRLVTVPFEHAPFARDQGRMWRTPGNGEERQRVAELVRGVATR